MSQIRGTPKYTNPNLNFKDYKYEWDIYSLGVVYYEIFSEGKFFFDMGGFG
jgi:serine/threonine protein kinase